MNVYSVGVAQLYLEMECELIDAYYLFPSVKRLQFKNEKIKENTMV